jgi:3-oxoadipate enol-lactonase
VNVADNQQAGSTAAPATSSVHDVVVNGVRLRVEQEGAGAETVVFSHGMLRDRRMFDAQVAALRDRYRCVRYDHRGQGDSESPRAAIIPMETVYDDAVALIEALGLSPCHWVGLSMGGMVGMRLAARRPDLLRSVTLLETTAERDSLRDRIQGYLSLAVRTVLGPRLAVKIVLEPTMRLFYGSTFRNDPTRRSDYLAERADMARKLQTTSSAVIRGVLRRPPVVDELHAIPLPTMVIVGDEDAPIPPEKAKRLADAIPQAGFEVVAGAGHSSSVEQPSALTALIAGFLDGLPR